MKRSTDHDLLLRWYPQKWRARYGEEFKALLDDTYGSRRPTLRAVLSIAKNGSRERVREVGWTGDTLDARERLRAGSLLIVCSWSLFVVAGAVFAKFSEHWDTFAPGSAHGMARAGYDAVRWSGEVGMGLVVLAALIVTPSFVRFLRDGGWPEIRRSTLRTGGAGLSFVAMTAALALWAHHLSATQRNGGLVIYSVAFVLWGLGAVALVATTTSSIVTMTRAIRLSDAMTRIGALLATLLTFVMVVVTAGTATWWVVEAKYAPRVLGATSGTGFLGAPEALAPALVLAGVLMLIGLLSAAWGVARMSSALRAN